MTAQGLLVVHPEAAVSRLLANLDADLGETAVSADPDGSAAAQAMLAELVSAWPTCTVRSGPECPAWPSTSRR